MTIRAKDPADVGFIGEWINFVVWASRPAMYGFMRKELQNKGPIYNFFVNVDPEYSKCRKEFFECLADQMNPFTPSVSSVGTEMSKRVEFY